MTWGLSKLDLGDHLNKGINDDVIVSVSMLYKY